jgi:hypothetical protein
MATAALVLLTVFYGGAVAATGWSWLCVRSGTVSFSVLRDVTGINDPAVMRRLFGLTAPDGSYRVTLADVLRHRRAAGMVLTDLPVYLLFLAALSLAWLLGAGPVANAVLCAAAAHALVVAAAALAVVAGRPQPLTGRR